VKSARVAIAAVAVAATGLLGACTSQPSIKAQAKDVVQSLTVPSTGQRLPQGEQDCMIAVIDKKTEDQLKRLGAENLNATINSSGGGNAEMQAFIDDMQRCQTSTSTPTSTAGSSTATTAPSSTTTTTLG
jgi:hypothetical protein